LASGNVSSLGKLQVARGYSIATATSPTGAEFELDLPTNGSFTSTIVAVPRLLQQGDTLGPSGPFVSVQWSIPTDGDSSVDAVEISYPGAAIKYVYP
jgi:hypothetical protein